MATGHTGKLPLVVIVGPTASGKTTLAIEVAKRHKGEIICADSRTVYKGMDIGTAKPSLVERAMVPHWGLDLVEPNQPFNVADFQKYAYQKIDEIRARGHIPFLVGGSGLYIDAVLFNFQFNSPASLEQRRELENLSLEELQKYCIENSVKLPENVKNKRHLIRAIERNNIEKQRRIEPISTSIIVGIATDRSVLRKRIHERSEQIFHDNVVNEATLLGKKYGWNIEAMTGNIYPLVYKYLNGELAFEEMKEKFATADWRLAKRQLTWLKRNPYIKWFELDRAQKYLEDQLAKK